MLLEPRILTWVVITAVAVVVAYGLGRVHEQPPARKPPSEFRQAKRAAQAARKPITAKADRRARGNGWLPPVNRQLTTLAVSPECAAGWCHACDGCEHKCGHDSALIVARNAAAYDAALPDEPPY